MAPVDHAWGVSAAADEVWAQVCGLRPGIAGARLFMVLQAYMDESYDDGGVFVIAGYISSAERWANFSKEWAEALPLATRSKSGFRFKMSEMATSPERLARVATFHDIIQRHAMIGVSFILDKRDLDNALNRLSIDNVGHLLWEQSPDIYFLCVRIFLQQFHRLLARSEELISRISGPIDFFFDDHSQKKWILSSWDECVQNEPEDIRRVFGATPQFRDDDEFLPLQAADFQAWWVRKWAKQLGPKNVQEGEYEGFVPSSKKIFHVRMCVDEDQLAEMLKFWLSDSLSKADLPEDVFRIRDTKSAGRKKTISDSDRIDPPFPLERLMAYLKSVFAKLFLRDHG